MATPKNWKALIEEAKASDAGGGNFEAVPVGTYDMRVVESTATQSQKGKDMYKLKCEIVNGPHRGQKIFTQLVLSRDSPVALGIFMRQMNVLGVSHEFLGNNPTDEEIARKLLNARFTGQIDIREWNGQERNGVKNILPPSVDNTEDAAPLGPPAPPVAAPKVDMFPNSGGAGTAKKAPAPAPVPAPAGIGSGNAAPEPPF